MSSRFSCGDSVESQVWASWDGSTFMHNWIQGDINRVTQQGDVYGLYDFQIESENMWNMAQRCGRTNRLQEAAALINSTYSKLQAAPNGGYGRAWVCTGGAGTVCYDSGLANTEVKLVSFQFLGAATFVANALANSGAALSSSDKAFINNTIAITNEHLVRWANDYQIERLQTMMSATTSSPAWNDSFLLFSDIDLWHLTIYAEMAGLRKWQASQGIAVDKSNDTRLQSHMNALLAIFNKRTSLITASTTAKVPGAAMADVDRGFWGNMLANTYASYSGSTKPVVCSPSTYTNVSTSSFTKRNDTGWDFSHARRLVQAMDGLERNRAAMLSSYALTDSQLPPTTLPKAFAAALLNNVWNGDTAQPGFNNYWSGANGWFGAYYSSSISYCDEGMKPYSMADSFPTGGYVTWAKHYPVIGQLGATIYDLMSNSTSAGSSFMTTMYPRLSSASGADNKAISMFMFLPSLVGVGIQ
ncbi:hypothetical protein [Noviherbaspirillum galbum]|uniref:Uncharacterized protein n=1 Tax=Noviherbaspirillum galbum TaxID=2709383 RepID=A0A6B3SU91_9BURK|nr:hypothetical protein [Noviherbaspirillum galbum]NEX64038.1 hypothetical protein [Noviherbaspirillum galbum]